MFSLKHFRAYTFFYLTVRFQKVHILQCHLAVGGSDDLILGSAFRYNTLNKTGMQINQYEDRLKSSKAYQDTLEESEQMRFIFQYNTPGGPHTSSTSVAVFESLISIKSSTADMPSSYTLFSTWTFTPLLNSSLEIKAEAVYFLRLYKNVIFAFSNFACSFFNLNITDLFPSEKRFKL